MPDYDVITVRMSRSDPTLSWGFRIAPPRRIQDVEPQSLAERAGLKNGDLVDEMQCEREPELCRLLELIGSAAHQLDLIVLRESAISTVSNANSRTSTPMQFDRRAAFPTAKLYDDPPAHSDLRQRTTASRLQSAPAVRQFHGSTPMAKFDPAVAASSPAPVYLRSEALKLIRESERARGPPQSTGGFANALRAANGPTTECFCCGRMIIGQSNNAAAKSVHPECFQCSTCGAPLTEQSYQFVNDKFYCDVHGKQRQQIMVAAEIRDSQRAQQIRAHNNVRQPANGMQSHQIGRPISQIHPNTQTHQNGQNANVDRQIIAPATRFGQTHTAANNGNGNSILMPKSNGSFQRNISNGYSNGQNNNGTTNTYSYGQTQNGAKAENGNKGFTGAFQRNSESRNIHKRPPFRRRPLKRQWPPPLSAVQRNHAALRYWKYAFDRRRPALDLRTVINDFDNGVMAERDSVIVKERTNAYGGGGEHWERRIVSTPQRLSAPMRVNPFAWPGGAEPPTDGTIHRTEAQRANAPPSSPAGELDDFEETEMAVGAFGGNPAAGSEMTIQQNTEQLQSTLPNPADFPTETPKTPKSTKTTPPKAKPPAREATNVDGFTDPSLATSVEREVLEESDLLTASSTESHSTLDSNGELPQKFGRLNLAADEERLLEELGAKTTLHQSPSALQSPSTLQPAAGRPSNPPIRQSSFSVQMAEAPVSIRTKDPPKKPKTQRNAENRSRIRVQQSTRQRSFLASPSSHSPASAEDSEANDSSFQPIPPNVGFQSIAAPNQRADSKNGPAAAAPSRRGVAKTNISTFNNNPTAAKSSQQPAPASKANATAPDVPPKPTAEAARRLIAFPAERPSFDAGDEHPNDQQPTPDPQAPTLSQQRPESPIIHSVQNPELIAQLNLVNISVLDISHLDVWAELEAMRQTAARDDERWRSRGLTAATDENGNTVGLAPMTDSALRREFGMEEKWNPVPISSGRGEVETAMNSLKRRIVGPAAKEAAQLDSQPLPVAAISPKAEGMSVEFRNSQNNLNSIVDPQRNSQNRSNFISIPKIENQSGEFPPQFPAAHQSPQNRSDPNPSPKSRPNYPPPSQPHSSSAQNPTEADDLPPPLRSALDSLRQRSRSSTQRDSTADLADLESLVGSRGSTPFEQRRATSAPPRKDATNRAPDLSALNELTNLLDAEGQRQQRRGREPSGSQWNSRSRSHQNPKENFGGSRQNRANSELRGAGESQQRTPSGLQRNSRTQSQQNLQTESPNSQIGFGNSSNWEAQQSEAGYLNAKTQWSNPSTLSRHPTLRQSTAPDLGPLLEFPDIPPYSRSQPANSATSRFPTEAAEFPRNQSEAEEPLHSSCVSMIRQLESMCGDEPDDDFQFQRAPPPPPIRTDSIGGAEPEYVNITRPQLLRTESTIQLDATPPNAAKSPNPKEKTKKSKNPKKKDPETRSLLDSAGQHLIADWTSLIRRATMENGKASRRKLFGRFLSANSGAKTSRTPTSHNQPPTAAATPLRQSQNSIPQPAASSPHSGENSPPAGAPSCESCRAEIETWCPDHFVCANSACARPLLDCGFVEDEGQKYCEKCFETLIAPSCAKCGNAITADCLNALQQQWHPNCFVCTHCRRPFGNTAFYLENGKPYCEKDWNQLFTTKCISCKFPIEAGDRWIEAIGSAFHSNCFNCSSCQVNLEGQNFYARDGRPYCRAHV